MPYMHGSISSHVIFFRLNQLSYHRTIPPKIATVQLNAAAAACPLLMASSTGEIHHPTTVADKEQNPGLAAVAAPERQRLFHGPNLTQVAANISTICCRISGCCKSTIRCPISCLEFAIHLICHFIV